MSFVWRSGLKHHMLLRKRRLEDRGFLDSFNPSTREKKKKCICDYFLYAGKRLQTLNDLSITVHSPFTDLAVTCSKNVVKSVFVIKFKMQWRFWFFCSERESEKGLTFQSCYILDTTNKIIYKCKINKDSELKIFIIVYKIHIIECNELVTVDSLVD